nr:sodium:alanine symporter [Algoriphagus sp.]
VQSNSIALSVNNAFDVPVEYTGGVVCLFLAMVIFGGIKRIGKVAEILVPFMAMGYVLLAIIIIGINITEVPTVLKLIVSSAFNQEAAYSAVFGSAIAWGVKRGIYSNEAGQGTAPHAASAAEVSHPAKQGLVQAFSVYIDTLFVCTATACMILFTGQFNVLHPDGGFLVENLPGIAIGPEFTQNAIAVHFPTIGAGFVAVALMFFSFTTIMAYYYIAETNLSYLQKNDTQKWPIHVLRILIIIATFYGAIRTAQVAWTFGDIGVGLMAWLNIIAILLLRKPALEALKDYKKKKDAGEDPDYDFEGMKKHYSKN